MASYKAKSETLKADLKNWLGQAVPAAMDAGPRALKPRWDQVERVYACDKKYAGTTIYKGFEPRAYDVLGPIVRRICNVVMDLLLGPPTWCQAIPENGTQEMADALENGIQLMVDEAGAERKVRKGIENTANLGLGFLRVRMQDSGLTMDRIHPGHMVVAIADGQPLSEAGIVGHRLYRPFWEFRQMVAEGKYPMADKDDGLLRFIGRSSQSDPVGKDTERNPTGQVHTPGEEFEDVELYELLCRAEVEGFDYEGKGPKTGWYRVVWSDQAQEAVLCEPWPYDEHGYFDLRFHDEETFWPEVSVSYRILGLCMSQSEMLNFMETVALALAVPPTVLAGGSLGKKVKEVTIGQVVELNNPDAKVFPFPMQADLAALPALLQEKDNRINTSVGLSQHSLGKEHLEKQTATATADLQSQTQQNEGAYSGYVGDFLEPVWAFVHKLCRYHTEHVRKVYGDRLPEQFYRALRTKVRWRMTARSAGNAPQVLMAKLWTLLGMAGKTGSVYHYGRVEEAVGNALQVSTDMDGLKKTPEELQREAQVQMAALQGGTGQGSGGPDVASQGAGGPVLPAGQPGLAQGAL